MMADFGEVKSSMLLSIPCIPYSVLTYPTIYHGNSLISPLWCSYTHDTPMTYPMIYLWHKSCEKSMVPRPSKTLNRHPTTRGRWLDGWPCVDALCCLQDPSASDASGVGYGKKNIVVNEINIWLVVWKMTFIFPCIWNNHPS